MTSRVLDLDALLAPIGGDDPCGAEMRWDPVYDEIRKARIEDDRDMLGGDQPVEAEWPRVIELASDVIAHRSKDLMIAAWLTEAVTVIHGFAGLTDGLTLITRMLEEFWEGVYPRPDEEDLEPRVAPLHWLMDADRGARLPNRLRDLPVLPGDEAFSWSYWKSRFAPPKGETEDDSDYERRRQEAEERGRRFEEALAVTDLSWLSERHQDVLTAKEALQAFDRKATEKFGMELAPAVTPFRTALEEIEALLRRMVKDKGGFAEAAEPVAGAPADTPHTSGNGQAASSGPIQSREDAFRRLGEVSAYLRRTEPQSPVPLLIDRAITWGRMPFEQLVREMIKDESVRTQISELLGIHSNSESE